MSPKPISWWSDYLVICLDIRISRPSYLAATCPNDRGRSYPGQFYLHPEPNHNLNLRVETQTQAKHFNSLARDPIVGQRSCPCAPQDARAHAECERYYQFDSIWAVSHMYFLSWTMENYETCFKSFTIDPKSNQSDQPCRRVVLTSSITLSHQEDLSLTLLLSPASKADIFMLPNEWFPICGFNCGRQSWFL